jgi:ribA/ribD-fused uncharacterized protein
MEKIKTFTGAHAFLSNFWPSPINYEGIEYPTVEHAFQAAKTKDVEIRQTIAKAKTAGAAKRAGGKRGILKDFDHVYWEANKNRIMLDICRVKFCFPGLRDLLEATKDAVLEEGNNWNDTYWGISLKTGKGHNNLGLILMRIREENRVKI